MSDYSKSLLGMRQEGPSEVDTFRPFVATQAGWLAVSVPIVASFGMASTESVFVLAFVGFLSACLLFEPVESNPRWWRLSVWVSRGGFVVLGYWVFQRARELGI
ncbi:hypothetical protein [Halobellus limi]|uniref:Uncharacterized protein n=1 Tax=Halobellus limi TaxID=699433 RepID=A0A1H6BCY1_9EURY|nr:hypothetical protein [Halobellus limi]QCC49293.1 hypothetical protein DV707_16235 [Halobellus limi]SEG58703.1 hypothetical protein SAMN04488133_2774 [Halobellus limi]